MTKCTTNTDVIQPDLFPNCRKRKIKVDFEGGEVSSDGGMVLLRQIDRRFKIVDSVTAVLKKYDKRQEGKIEHDIRSMLVQRIYGMALGYEDLNDHHTLRHDTIWQTVAEKDSALASPSTLCRFENRAFKKMCMELIDLQIKLFIDSFDHRPGEIVLDFDNTDIPLHGEQEGRFFHGYYDEYCFIPLYIYCGEKLVASLLQPSCEEGAKHAGVMLKKVVAKLRSKWPGVKIIYRGDSGFARKRHLYWCERNNVDYLIGIGKNDRLKKAISDVMQKAEKQYGKSGEKSIFYTEFMYAARSWHHGKRKVIAKAEYGDRGENPRFVLTTLSGDAGNLYSRYCGRGDMENRIKEIQPDLFGYRTSAHQWWTNQFRILLVSFAYILFEKMRNTALKNTRLAKAQVSTIRLKLLKIGAVVRRNTRSIYIHLSSSYPYKFLFWRVAAAFAPG